MSTLSYLDENGKVSYSYVGWKDLNDWLSSLNSGGNIGKEPPKGVNRGKIIGELEHRLKRKKNRFGEDVFVRGIARINRGLGNDWCKYENELGCTHLEELLIYQPVEWRNQAREYVYQFRFKVERESCNPNRCMEWTTIIEGTEYGVPVIMWFPILVVLFHPDMKRSARYEPLNLLLAYDCSNTGPSILPFLEKYIGYFSTNYQSFREKIEDDLIGTLKCRKSANSDMLKETPLCRELKDKLNLELSSLDYFFIFNKEFRLMILTCSRT